MNLHKRLSTLCVAVMLLIGSLVLPAAAADPQIHWRGTFAHQENNAVVTAPLPSDPDRVEQVWSKKVGNNTVVIVDDAVYTYDGVNTDLYGSYSDGGTFYKLDAETGDVLRSVDCKYGTRFYYSYSIYANGRIYVGCPTAIMAFDPETCAPVWTYEHPNAEWWYPTLQYVNGCIVSNGTVLDADTGEVVATITAPKWGAGWSNGVEIGGEFYVADATESLYEIDTATWNATCVWASGYTAATSCGGVMHYDGALYWGGVSGNFHRMSLETDEVKTVDANIKCYGTPVAYNGRVYVAGMAPNDTETNTGPIAIGVYAAKDFSKIYQTDNGINGKIQGTPILAVTGSGSVRIYVQAYAKPGAVYCLEDSSSKTSGKLVKLLTPDQENFAWEQLACDGDGALYVTNDNGYLMKYRTAPFSGGDVNHDDVVNGDDAALLSQYIAQWNVKISKDQADTNGDGSIDIADLIVLRRYLDNWYS